MKSRHFLFLLLSLLHDSAVSANLPNLPFTIHLPVPFQGGSDNRNMCALLVRTKGDSLATWSPDPEEWFVVEEEYRPGFRAANQHVPRVGNDILKSRAHAFFSTTSRLKSMAWSSPPGLVGVKFAIRQPSTFTFHFVEFRHVDKKQSPLVKEGPGFSPIDSEGELWLWEVGESVTFAPALFSANEGDDNVTPMEASSVPPRTLAKIGSFDQKRDRCTRGLKPIRYSYVYEMLGIPWDNRGSVWNEYQPGAECKAAEPVYFAIYSPDSKAPIGYSKAPIGYLVAQDVHFTHESLDASDTFQKHFKSGSRQEEVTTTSTFRHFARFDHEGNRVPELGKAYLTFPFGGLREQTVEILKTTLLTAGPISEPHEHRRAIDDDSSHFGVSVRPAWYRLSGLNSLPDEPHTAWAMGAEVREGPPLLLPARVRARQWPAWLSLSQDGRFAFVRSAQEEQGLWDFIDQRLRKPSRELPTVTFSRFDRFGLNLGAQDSWVILMDTQGKVNFAAQAKPYEYSQGAPVEMVLRSDKQWLVSFGGTDPLIVSLDPRSYQSKEFRFSENMTELSSKTWAMRGSYGPYSDLPDAIHVYRPLGSQIATVAAAAPHKVLNANRFNRFAQVVPTSASGDHYIANPNAIDTYGATGQWIMGTYYGGRAYAETPLKLFISRPLGDREIPRVVCTNTLFEKDPTKSKTSLGSYAVLLLDGTITGMFLNSSGKLDSHWVLNDRHYSAVAVADNHPLLAAVNDRGDLTIFRLHKGSVEILWRHTTQFSQVLDMKFSENGQALGVLTKEGRFATVLTRPIVNASRQ